MVSIFETKKERMKGGTIGMRISRKGAKDNRTRLVWSKYFKYTAGEKEYYFKQKAYATYSDGLIDWETIKKQTYKNAIKRGNECIEVSLEENLLKVPVEFIVSMFSQEYGMPEGQIKRFITMATRAIRQIKRHSTMGSVAEYRIFKRMLEYQINLIKKVKQHEV